jgi:hypothetical protein
MMQSQEKTHEMRQRLCEGNLLPSRHPREMPVQPRFIAPLRAIRDEIPVHSALASVLLSRRVAIAISYDRGGRFEERHRSFV